MEFYNDIAFDKVSLTEQAFIEYRKHIIKMHQRMYFAPKKTIKETNVVFTSTEDFESCSSIPEGIFTFKLEDFILKSLFFKKESPYLFVTFTGRRRKDGSFPSFVRWRYHTSFPGSTLCFEDPMLFKYPNLDLGWFYGTKESSYVHQTAEIVLQIAKKLKVPNQNIIFFSSSGGGSVALQIANIIKPSTAIAVNPQIYFEKWQSAAEFTSITGIDLHDEDKYGRNSLAKNILNNRESKFIIMANISSKQDFIGQILPFCKEGKINPKYGITQKENLLLWCHATDVSYKPHNSFETRAILQIIISLALNFSLAESSPSLFHIITEFWNEFHTCKNSYINKINEENEKHAKQCLELENEIAALKKKKKFYVQKINMLKSKIATLDATSE